MPTYEYRCKACGHHLEIVQAFTDDALTACPSCKEATLRKVFGSVGIAFKGSGFYKNDSRGASKTSSAGASSTSSTSTSSSTNDGSATTSNGSGSSGSEGAGSGSSSGGDGTSSTPAKAPSDAKSA